MLRQFDTGRRPSYSQVRIVLRKVIHLLLCNMALVQLGAVPPCLLDEALGPTLGLSEADAARPSTETSGARIWCDEDAGDPRFAGIRASVSEPQTNLTFHPANPTRVVSPASLSFLLPPVPHVTVHRFYGAGPPPDALAVLNPPLLI